MTDSEIVGEFEFGSGKISANRTGAFTLALSDGKTWQFDVGEISSLDRVLRGIEDKVINPTMESPEVFWRTSGSKVIEVYLDKAYLGCSEFLFSSKTDVVSIREGGTAVGHIPCKHVSVLRRYIRVLTENAPYPRAIRLLDVIEEESEEQLFRTERFPLNNRNSRTPLRLERVFSQETIRTMDISASFGVGVDYYITVNLETKFGLTREKRIGESIKVAMEAEPGEHKEYVIIWKEVLTKGFAIFEINGVREKVPFRLKSGLIPDVRQEIVAHDEK